MIIYIECVLFNNLAIDCLMLYLSLLTLKRKIKLWRIFLSAVIGAVYALFSPLIEFTGDIVIKIAIAFIMCLITVKILSLKKLIILFLVFIGYSFAFGGVIIGLMNKNKFLFKEKDFIKIVRSEIYNPDFQYLYKKADIERGILAFEVFVFKEGYKLAVYSDGIAEVYLLETDAKINNEKLKMELYNRIKNSITVCTSK